MRLLRVTAFIVCGLLVLDIAATLVLDWRDAPGMQDIFHTSVMQSVCAVIAGATLLWLVASRFGLVHPATSHREADQS